MKKLSMANQQQIKVDISQATDGKCLQCGNDIFNTRYRLKIVSHMAPGNPYGKDLQVPMQIFQCAKCSWEFGTPAKGEVNNG